MKKLFRILLSLLTFVFAEIPKTALAAGYLKFNIPYQWFNGVHYKLTESGSAASGTTGYTAQSNNPFINAFSRQSNMNVSGCSTGYTIYRGGFTASNFATGSGNTLACLPNASTITLNRNGGSNGTATLYTLYQEGVYTRARASYPTTYMNYQLLTGATSSNNKITVPTGASLTLTYNANASDATVSPTSVSKNKVFNGYYSATSGGTQYISSSGIITSNGNTTAKGYNGTTATWYAQYGNPASVTLPTPTRPGYICTGWYDSASGGTKIGNVGASYTITASKTLYAQWAKATCNITNGTGTPTVSNNQVTCSVTCNSGYSKTGYTDTTTTFTTAASSSATVTASCEARTYKASLDPSPGSGGTTQYWYRYNTSKSLSGGTCYYYTVNLTSSSNETEANCLRGNNAIPTRTNYTFDGYYSAANGAGTQYVNHLGERKNNLYKTIPSSGTTTTLYANWTAVNYAIIYNADGGQCPAGSTVNLISAHPAASWTMDGVTFTTTGNGVYTLNGTATADITYPYIPVNTFTIPTAVGNGGTGLFALNNNKIVSGVELQFYAEVGKIDGWLLSSLNRFSTTYSTMAGQTVKKIVFYIPNGTTLDNVTVAPAIYNDSRTTPGTFVVNSVSGHTDRCQPVIYNVDSSAITLPTPAKDDNVFGGWYDNSNFTGNAVTTIPAGSTGNKEFWAKWRPIHDIWYICKRYPNNDFDIGATYQIVYGDIFHVSNSNETCEQTGYNFTGWDCQANMTHEPIADGDVYEYDHGIACDAQYSLATYNIYWNTDGGTWQPEQVNRPTTYTYEDPNITFDIPTKSGYTFMGWCIYDSATNNGANCSDLLNPSNPDPNFVSKTSVAIPHNSTGDRWVYAKFRQNIVDIWCSSSNTVTRTASGNSYTLGSVDYECGLSGDKREFFVCGDRDNLLGLATGDFQGLQEAESVTFNGTNWRKFCAPAQMIIAEQYETNEPYRLRMFYYDANQGYVITPTGREYNNGTFANLNNLENYFTASHTETLATFKTNLITNALGPYGTGSKFWIANRMKLPGDDDNYQSYSYIDNDLTVARLYSYHDKDYSEIVNIIYGDQIDIKCSPDDANAAATVVWPGNVPVPDGIYQIADGVCDRDLNRRELYCYTVGVNTEYRLTPDIVRNLTTKSYTDGESVCYFKDVVCPAGTYLPANSTTCTQCPMSNGVDGKYCPGGMLIWSETEDVGVHSCTTDTGGFFPHTKCVQNGNSWDCTGNDNITDCFALIDAYSNGGTYSNTNNNYISYYAHYNTTDNMFIANTETYKFKVLPTTPTRTGYNFAGWQYTLPPNNLTGLLDTQTQYSSDMAVYAQWTPKQITCQPGYYITAGSENCDTVCPAGSYCTGGTFTYNGNAQGKAPCPTAYPHSDQSSVSLPACYAIITYNLNGGSAIQYNPVEWHYNANYPDYYLINPFPATTKNGYTATWWTTSNFQSGTQVDTTTHMIGDQTLYAKWTANTITLNWNNGGHGTAPSTPATCTYDSSFTMPAALTETGYTFNSWTVNNKNFTAGQSVACTYANLGKYSGTATITATWTANTIDLTWNANGGNSAATNTGSGGSAAACTYDGDITLPNAEPTKTGFSFMGWKLDNN